MAKAKKKAPAKKVEEPTSRYFHHPEGSLTVVHNLSDPQAHLDEGYEEIDEDTYQAEIDKLDADVLEAGDVDGDEDS